MVQLALTRMLVLERFNYPVQQPSVKPPLHDPVKFSRVAVNYYVRLE